MTKKLKIRFVKFECALVAQQLEIEGFSFAHLKHVKINQNVFRLDKNAIWFKYECPFFPVSNLHFNDNTERDECLNNVVKWISEEQFAMGGKLEIGKLCDVSDDNKDWRRRTLLAVLPKSYFSKYIASEKYSDFKWLSWKYARPIGSCVQPKIDGDVYTWEMEVSDER